MKVTMPKQELTTRIVSNFDVERVDGVVCMNELSALMRVTKLGDPDKTIVYNLVDDLEIAKAIALTVFKEATILDVLALAKELRERIDREANRGEDCGPQG